MVVKLPTYIVIFAVISIIIMEPVNELLTCYFVCKKKTLLVVREYKYRLINKQKDNMVK